jgi:uncharacterized protein
MRSDGSRQFTVDSLVAGGDREFAFPLAELPRLESSLAEPVGQARGSVTFEQVLGVPVASIAVTADLRLVCQRCMQAMDWPVESRSRVALVHDLAAADRLPDGLESIIVENDRVSVRDLVEEELLLALPVVPKCEAGDTCSRLSAQAVAVETPEALEAAEPIATQTPFAQLGELLKRGK